MTRQRLLPFIALEGATLLSGLGNGVAMVAVPWLVLDLTGSAGAAGVVAGVTALPLLLSSLFSGTVVDLIGRRRTSVISDLFSAASVAAIPAGRPQHRSDVHLGARACHPRRRLRPCGSNRTRVDAHRRRAGNGHAAGTRQRSARSGLGCRLRCGPGYRRGADCGGRAPSALCGSSAWGSSRLRCCCSSSTCPAAGRPEAEDRPTFWRGTGDGLKLVFQDPVLRNVTLLSTGIGCGGLSRAWRGAARHLPSRKRAGSSRRGSDVVQPRWHCRCAWRTAPSGTEVIRGLLSCCPWRVRRRR